MTGAPRQDLAPGRDTPRRGLRVWHLAAAVLVVAVVLGLGKNLGVALLFALSTLVAATSLAVLVGGWLANRLWARLEGWRTDRGGGIARVAPVVALGILLLFGLAGAFLGLNIGVELVRFFAPAAARAMGSWSR